MNHAAILAAGAPLPADAMPAVPDASGMAPEPAPGLASTSPGSYMQILQQAVAPMWAAEDAQIADQRHAALWQAVLAAGAPAGPVPALPAEGMPPVGM